MNDIIFDPPPELIDIRVGDPFPESTGFVGEGAAVRLLEGQGMWVVVQMDTPTSMEANAYRNGKIAFGVFQHPVKFPWGIFLFTLQTSAGKTIYQEVPMGIEGEAKLRPQAVSDWLAGAANALHIILVDTRTRRTVGIRSLGLTPQIVSKLGMIWQDQLRLGCSLELYYRDLNTLQTQFSTQQLWDRAEKFWLKK